VQCSRRYSQQSSVLVGASPTTAGVHYRSSSRRLQLNDSRQNSLFGKRSRVAKLIDVDTPVIVGVNITQPSTAVRDVGNLLDSELSMKQHINKATSTYIDCIGFVDSSDKTSQFCLFARLYCHDSTRPKATRVWKICLPKSTMAPLQRI